MNIDVLIPCAGSAEFVSETIDSVLNQSYIPASVYVIDNGCSHDRYKVIVDQKKDDRLNYIRFEERLRMTENWQRCLEIGSSEYVAFLHDDDVWNKDYLSEAVKTISAKPGTGICLTAHAYFDGQLAVNSDEIKLSPHLDKISYINSLNEPIRSYFLATSSSGHMSAIVFKRCHIGFPLNSQWMPDQEFMAMYIGYSNLELILKPGVYIRKSPTNVTASLNTKGFISVETIKHLRKVTEFFIKNKNLEAREIHDLRPDFKGYKFKLIQACFSWPLNYTLIKFGKELISFKHKDNDGNIIFRSRWMVNLLAIKWVLSSLFADIKYFYRDYKNIR